MLKTLNLTYPIIQAGMAGGATTPNLVASVSNTGALGTLGAGYMSPNQIRTAIHLIREQTTNPFAVNLFIPEPAQELPDQKQINHMNQILNTYRKQLNIPESPHVTEFSESFEEQLVAVIEEKVPILSFTFGIPSPSVIQELKRHHIILIGTATTVGEAITLEQQGIDMIVAQGSEAGGHRGSFIKDHTQSMIGTMALVPQIVDRVSLPVIAAGGIMDGRGMAAALALGASGVQMGTAFLTCEESGAHPSYKEALLNSGDDQTAITLAFSGKAARGLNNT
jgi:nitronate monooxygenase